MRRRVKVDEARYDGTPERLARFDPDEWPGTYQQAADAWWAAREAWEAQTGRVPFLALDPTPPDVSFDRSLL